MTQRGHLIFLVHVYFSWLLITFLLIGAGGYKFRKKDLFKNLSDDLVFC